MDFYNHLGTKSTKDHSQLLKDHSKLLENCKEKLERMEMRRYRAFMFLHGYNHGASSGDKNIDRALRINETLLDENLSSDHKKKDASIVQITLKALVPMLTFAKKPIPAKVSFALADGEMETLEGLVKFQKGDALNIGSLGEHWPISRATFESTYEPQGNFQMGLDGMYVKKFMRVNAVQVNCATTIELSQQRGALAAVVGDWVVTDPNGKQWVVANQIFRDTYMPI